MAGETPGGEAFHFADDEAAASFLFKSLHRAMGNADLHGPDSEIRDLTPTRQLLDMLDLPAPTGGSLLVTGSKGKGSTAVMAARILERLGYTVGLMTSPSLVNFRERIRVNGRAISSQAWISSVQRIAPMVEQIDATLPADRYFSPTGMILALAQMHFAESGVQIAVVEAGRGGRFDDTRLTGHDVSVITPVMREHVEELGPTLRDIALHKAGIIDAGNTVISAAQHPVALQEIEREAAEQDAVVNLLGREFEAAFVHGGDLDRPGLAMTLRTEAHDYGELWVPLLGRYQVENAALAVSAVEAMLEHMGAWPGAGALERGVRAGLNRVSWPGRCHVLRTDSLVILDGAINAESARLFCESIAQLVRPPVVALVSVPASKDYQGVYRQLAKLADSLVLTRFDSPYLRFLDDDKALSKGQQYFEQVVAQPDFASGYARARQLVGDDGTVLVVGTQSLLKAALRYWDFDLEAI